MTRRRRLALAALGVVIALLGAATLDLAIGLSRVQRIPISAAPDDAVTTWLLVGSDTREGLPDDDRARYADPVQARGERADVLVVLQRSATGTRALSLPRDLVVGTQRRATDRLASRLLHGPAALTDSVCLDLGIAVDHLVIVDFTAVIALVDAVGGIEVTLEHPVRDRKARLDLPTSGPQLLDGSAALAWVRSRQAEELVDGVWQPVENAGQSRPEHLQDVLRQMVAQMTSPWAAHRILHEVGCARSLPSS